MNRTVTWIPALAACFFLLSQPSASAADYPKQTVQIVVGASPGGTTDTLSRLLAQRLTEKWGQPVVVQNRPGAGHRLAADFVAHSKPDGYTLQMMVNDLVLPAPKGVTLHYDPVKSFSPVVLAAVAPNCLVAAANYPPSSFKELVAWAKTNPDKLNYTVNGGDGPYELALRRLMVLTGIKIEFVRYPGSAPSLVAVLNGEAQVTGQPCANFLPQLEAGKIKLLAITEKSDIPLLSKAPTFEEASGLPDWDGGGPNWYGLIAPAGTPKDIIGKIHADVLAILKTEDIKQKLMSQFVLPNLTGTPETFAALIKKDTERWDAWSKQTESLLK